MSEGKTVIVVGAGILGLAHAYHLAKGGAQVHLIERGPAATDASIRNFGMIWPMGQPAGPRRDLALRSRAIWEEVLRDAGLWHAPVGSLHLALEDDEVAVLEEFAREAAKSGFTTELLDGRDLADRAPGVVHGVVKRALLSPYEMTVDPREVVRRLPAYLAERFGVQVHFEVTALAWDGDRLRTSVGTLPADHLIVCSGRETSLLFPEALATAGLKPCKLQMMRTGPQPGGWRLGPMLAAGLTLLHYESFANCPTLGALRQRLDQFRTRERQHGIHVMAAQNGLGEIILGDSHHYGDAITPFDQPEVDDLILAEATRWLRLPAPHITARWHGIYLKHPAQPWVILHPTPNATIVTGVGGAGMTLSFGLAERVTQGHR